MTLDVTDITMNSAICSGSVILSGGANVYSKGICWDTKPNPMVNLLTKTGTGNEKNHFSGFLTNLKSSTTYYVRAYATNENGTGYGEEISFTTKNNIIFEETFSSGIGSFSVVNLIGDQVWAFRVYQNIGYMMITGYNTKNEVNEDWIISPEIDLSKGDNPYLSFNHTGRYFTDFLSEATLWVSFDYKGGSIRDANWTQVTINNYFTNTNYFFVNSGNLSLNEFKGKKIHIAFKYISTTSSAGVWELNNFKVISL